MKQDSKKYIVQNVNDPSDTSDVMGKADLESYLTDKVEDRQNISDYEIYEVKKVDFEFKLTMTLKD